jgi:hypothetical protein
MNRASPMPRSLDGRPRLAVWLYIGGLLLPFMLFEQAEWFPHASVDSLPHAIALGMLLLGPTVSVFAAVTSPWSILIKVVMTVLIPVFLVALFLTYWVAGAQFFDRPFLPLD